MISSPQHLVSWSVRIAGVSSSFVVELVDPLEPVAPCLCEQASDGRVLALLQRPDLDVTHALATAYQQPLWIR